MPSCGFLENELSQFSREEGVTLADSVETLGVDLRRKVKSLGVKKKRGGRNARYSLRKIRHSQQNYTGGRQEVATCRHDASKDVEITCSR